MHFCFLLLLFLFRRWCYISNFLNGRCRSCRYGIIFCLAMQVARAVYFFLEDEALCTTSATNIVEVPGWASSSDSLSKVTRDFFRGVLSSLVHQHLTESVGCLYRWIEMSYIIHPHRHLYRWIEMSYIIHPHRHL